MSVWVGGERERDRERAYTGKHTDGIMFAVRFSPFSFSFFFFFLTEYLNVQSCS